MHSLKSSQTGLVFVLTFLFVAPVGCANKSKVPQTAGEAVSGQVTLKGQPIMNGTVTFVGVGANTAARSTAIKDGRYSFLPENGPPAGLYKVEISNYPPGPTTERDSDPLPAKYSSASILTGEVKAGQPNVISFKLD